MSVPGDRQSTAAAPATRADSSIAGDGDGPIDARDWVIHSQARCIEQLETQATRVRRQRDQIATKAALLAYKLQMYSQSHHQHPHRHHHHHQCCQANHAASVNGLGPPSSQQPVVSVRLGPSGDSSHASVRVTPCAAGVHCHRLRSPPTSSFTCINASSPSDPPRSTAPVIGVCATRRARPPATQHYLYHQHRTSKRSADEDDGLSAARCRVAAAVSSRGYELSGDLLEKQVEMLCRKYGGPLRAGRAARVIQQAYRRYRLNRSFARIRLEAAASPSTVSVGSGVVVAPNIVENRLSRRFVDLAHATSGCYLPDMRRPLVDQWSCYYAAAAGFGAYYGSGPQNVDAMVTPPGGHTPRCVGQMSRLCTRVLVQKSHTVSVTTMTHEHRTVIERRPAGGHYRPACCRPPDTTSVGSTTDGQFHVQHHHQHQQQQQHLVCRMAHESPPPPTGVVSSSSSSSGLDQSGGSLTSNYVTSGTDGSAMSVFADHEPANVDDHFADVDDVLPGEAGFADSSFQQLSLTDSSYGDVVRSVTDDELDDDDEQERPVSDGYEQSLPAPSHVYSSLRLCGGKHSNSPSIVPYSTPADEDVISGAAEHRSSPADEARLSPSHVGSPIWKRKDGSTESVLGSCERRTRGQNAEYGVIPGRSRSGSDTAVGVAPGTSRSGSDTASNSSGGTIVGGNASLHTCTYARRAPVATSAASSKSNSAENLLECPPSHTCQHVMARSTKGSDKKRKRTYRIGLNLFNKKPEKGIKYLVDHHFLDHRPNAVARFLITRKGLSKLMIGEYLGNLQKPFNAQVLGYFLAEINLTGLQIDVALRKFQSYFRMPGEAQKIERLMEAFSNRYCQCNMEVVKQLRRPDTVFLLAFATVMLNTDLHNKSIKAERKMKLADFIKNLRGIDDGQDVDPEMLTGIYERVRSAEFQPSPDHVLQVVKVEQMIVGKKPQLALLHRRLVCYCRLCEIQDINRKEKFGQHQREVFLFNDMIMVTKIVGKRKNATTYTFRCSFPLYGVSVQLFETSCYKFGLRLVNAANNKTLLMLNARNDLDRSRFADDLQEAILEVTEMENLRIEEELEKQAIQPKLGNVNRYSKDSGVVDIELLKPFDGFLGSGANMTRECEEDNISDHHEHSSLTDSGEGDHTCSAGSLDSGMVSLHS